MIYTLTGAILGGATMFVTCSVIGIKFKYTGNLRWFPSAGDLFTFIGVTTGASIGPIMENYF